MLENISSVLVSFLLELVIPTALALCVITPASPLPQMHNYVLIPI